MEDDPSLQSQSLSPGLGPLVSGWCCVGIFSVGMQADVVLLLGSREIGSQKEKRAGDWLGRYRQIGIIA